MSKGSSRRFCGYCITVLLVASLVCFVLSFVTQIPQTILNVFIISFAFGSIALTRLGEAKPSSR